VTELETQFCWIVVLSWLAHLLAFCGTACVLWHDVVTMYCTAVEQELGRGSMSCSFLLMSPRTQRVTRPHTCSWPQPVPPAPSALKYIS